MMAFPTGSPAASTATVPDHCDVTEIAATSVPDVAARVFLVAVTIALHQARGSCSAPPAPSSSNPTDSVALPITVPSLETSATFGPEVPRSTARTYVEDCTDVSV